MPNYTYTGSVPRAMFGLSEGVNAEAHPADDVPLAPGQTIVVSPGDTLTTDEPYVHPELALIENEPQPTNADGTPIPVPLPDEQPDSGTTPPEAPVEPAEPATDPAAAPVEPEAAPEPTTPVL